MSVIWPSGATNTTFYVARHPIKSISNSVIEFDTRNVESVLPRELKKEASKIVEKINTHYLKSRQIEVRSFGDRHEDDFQQYNWGLTLTLEMGLFTDQAELLMVLYAREVDGRITEKEFSLMIALHTSFRHLPKHKQKLTWKDLMTSWKINMKQLKYLPPTISKKAFIRILDVNFIDFDINLDQLSKDLVKLDSEADELQSLLLDDPILRGEIPRRKGFSHIVRSEPALTSLEIASGVSSTTQERQRLLKLQKSFSEFEDLEKVKLHESESARRQAIDAANDELSLKVKEIKRERQIRKLQELEQSQLEVAAELLESTKSIPALARSISNLHIPVSLPNTARKPGFTPRSSMNTSRQPIDRSYSSPSPQPKNVILSRAQSLPDYFGGVSSSNVDESLFPEINNSTSRSSMNTSRQSCSPSPQPRNVILSRTQSLPDNFGGVSSSNVDESLFPEINNSTESLKISEADVQVLSCGVIVSQHSDNQKTVNHADQNLDLGPQSCPEVSLQQDHIIDMAQSFQNISSISVDDFSTFQDLRSSHPVGEGCGESGNISDPFSISEEASQPIHFPNLTDLFELPFIDLLINVPKTGNVLRILIRHDDEGDASGLFVHGFIPYSRAEEQGLIKVGDEIISVNNINVEGKQLDDVIAALKHHHDDYVPILVRRRDQLEIPSPWRSPRQSVKGEISPRPFTTEDGSQPDDFPDFSELLTLPSQKYLFMVPKTNGQLRIMIRHDDDGSYKGLFIHGFRPFSQAEAQGLLKIGDEILEIDGLNVAGGQVEDLIGVLKANHEEFVSMLICRRDTRLMASSTSWDSPRFHRSNSEFLHEVEVSPSSSFLDTQPSGGTFTTTYQEHYVNVPRTNGLLGVIIKSNEGAFYVHGFKGNCRAEEVLRPGDTILEIDGKPLTGLNLKEVASLITNCDRPVVPMLLSRNYKFPNTP